MKRQQIRVGGRWQNKKSARVAVVTQVVYPYAVEFKYERPTRYKGPYHGYMETEPYTRRTRVRYRSFILNFTKAPP